VVHHPRKSQGNADGYGNIGKGKTKIVKQGCDNPLIAQYPGKIMEPNKTDAPKALHGVPAGKTKEKRENYRQYDECKDTKKIRKNKKITCPFFLPPQNIHPAFGQDRVRQRSLLGNGGMELPPET
jgi:hypothetical protein